VGTLRAKDTLADFTLGAMGLNCDERKATAWFLRAAKEGGDYDAQFYTAQRYKNGTGHDAPNEKEAAKWYQAAVAQGHVAAHLHLGNCYDDGDGVKKNPGLALKLWRKCALQVHETQGFNPVAAAQYTIGHCYCLGSNGLEVDLPTEMQWWTKTAEQGNQLAQCVIGEIYLMGYEDHVPVGTFDRDVPLGMKYLRTLTLAERNYEDEEENADETIASTEALIRDFHTTKSCMGCGSAKARKLCSGCLYHADHAKVRYCGEACQLIHWRHATASHKAECGSRAAATRDGSGAA
jgi:hypothetical protein